MDKIKKQKIAQTEVYQATMREISYPFIFEKNIIEWHAAKEQVINQFVVNQFTIFACEKADILEIGLAPLLNGSQFISAKLFVPDSYKYYDKLNQLLDHEVQIVIVQTSSFSDEHVVEILSDIAATATKLRIIIFVTINNEPKILPILSFTQVKTQAILDGIGYRENEQKNIRLIELIYDRLLFSHMI
ncbi:hypothetical protein D3Z35_16070 [Enterococcus faecalis]|uniref:hypothetical protein n=1 Tax=Enterococcus faecalis TaxID=1351 RepID=UPI00080C5717|nr:hypothetical protein [Enterococcus faecalis]ANU71934.1 hypothetical protein A4V06_02165 [Enterococcus faecalis]ASU26633.1 hypothetical protein ADH73_11490 [Enterococcus faecalis]MCO8259821.1 hypothetical protein [Enterococcus faecalis]MCP8907844.1 hypothetical protein [Enterococcus faecalis]MCP8910886.1 hypothetical protein [Enterococcus faecalis]